MVAGTCHLELDVRLEQQAAFVQPRRQVVVDALVRGDQTEPRAIPREPVGASGNDAALRIEPNNSTLRALRNKTAARLSATQPAR